MTGVQLKAQKAGLNNTRFKNHTRNHISTAKYEYSERVGEVGASTAIGLCIDKFLMECM